MTITGLTIIGKEVALSPGDILEIEVSFDYKSPTASVPTLWASLGIGIGRDIESFKQIELSASSALKTWTGTTEIVIPTSGKSDGTYWMKVEIDGEEITIQNAVVITGMPTTGIGQIGDMIGMLVLVMMMSMMMNMMQDPEAFGAVAGRVVRRVRGIPERVKEVPVRTREEYAKGIEGTE